MGWKAWLGAGRWSRAARSTCSSSSDVLQDGRGDPIPEHHNTAPLCDLGGWQSYERRSHKPGSCHHPQQPKPDPPPPREQSPQREAEEPKPCVFPAAPPKQRLITGQSFWQKSGAHAAPQKLSLPAVSGVDPRSNDGPSSPSTPKAKRQPPAMHPTHVETREEKGQEEEYIPSRTVNHAE